MSLLDSASQWAKGEIFEANLMAFAGLGLVVLAWVFPRFGETPAARAMWIPLLVVGLLLLVAGVAGHITNQIRLGEFAAQFADDPAAFAQAEKLRVEGFQSLYTFTLVLAPVCFAAATALHWFSLNPHLRAVGIALALVGLAGLTIDFFSKERADRYYAAIRLHQPANPADS